MFPHDLFFGIDLYTIFLCLGLIGAILIFRIFSEKKKMNWVVQNFVVITAAASMFVGYYSAVLFQALYNIAKRGEFIIDEGTGATFYGGLIGGAACFLIIYFGVGHFFFKVGREHIKSFFTVADIAAASIALAHGLGRLGCLMAGCCHGGETDKWYGIYMEAYGSRMVPVQLWEALFLFALFAFFVIRLIKQKRYCLPIYMIAYGVWRFCIEFARGDERGSTVVDFLSPSQFIALIMIVGAVGLYFLQRYALGRIAQRERQEAEAFVVTEEDK